MSHQHTHSTHATIEQHKQRLRDAGYKLTNARTTVLEALIALGGHMTSAQVLDEVSQRDERIGRASVFRTLDLLTQLGMVRPTYIESGTPVYVLLPGGHHHHIICTRCNRVIEFDECGLSALEQHLEKRYGVMLTGHLLEFYGVCADCNARANEDS